MKMKATVRRQNDKINIDIAGLGLIHVELDEEPYASMVADDQGQEKTWGSRTWVAYPGHEIEVDRDAFLAAMRIEREAADREFEAHMSEVEKSVQRQRARVAHMDMLSRMD